MKHEDFLITTTVGGVSRKFVWNGEKPVDLDLPRGWALERTENYFRLVDHSFVEAKDRKTKTVVFPPPAPGKRVLLNVPQPHQGRGRPVSVEVVHLKTLRPVYSQPLNAQAAGWTAPRQLCMFYGQRYFLVRYRPVSAKGSHNLNLSGFQYEKSGGKYRIRVQGDGFEVKVGKKKTPVPRGSQFDLSEQEFLSATFIMGVQWWRFRMVPTPDQLPPIETDESDEDLRERENLRTSTVAVMGLLLGLSACLMIASYLSPAEKKVITTQVALKAPKLIPPVPEVKKVEPPKPEPTPEPPKVVEKKPPEPPPKVVKEKPQPKPKKPEPKIVKKAPKAPPAKKVAKQPAPTPPKPVAKAEPPPAPAPPRETTGKPTVDPATMKAQQLAAEKAAQQTQALKSLSFLSSSSKKPVAVANDYKSDSGQFAHVATVGGKTSKSNVLDNIAKGATGDGNIKTRSSREVASQVSFGKGKGKGLNDVQGKVSLNELASGGAPGEGLGGGRGLEISGPGTLSESEIEKALSKFLSRFQYCYEKSLLSNPNLSGNLVVQWDITAKGKASNSRVLKSQLANDNLHSCVLGVLKEVPFPKPKGGVATVKKTFSFTSASM